jgi:3-hydroxybutyryl-CoA dehydrogenase
VTTQVIQRIGVIGGGQMGAGIAEVCVRAGCSTIVVEADAAAAERALQRIHAALDKAVASGKLTEEIRSNAISALSVTHDLTALHDRDLVIEAIVENEAIKTELFRRLDEIVTSPTAILASNTSSIPIMKLAVATKRPEQVVGIHFFNPVPVLKLVELVTSLSTSEQTVTTAEAFATQMLGKRVIKSKDRAGFIVNALLIPYLLQAIRMFESGFATAEDIDAGMVEGCAHPMGPLKLCDLIGLDTTKAVADSLYAEFKEQLFSPPPLLSRMVEAGMLGRKTGKGFYAYK